MQEHKFPDVSSAPLSKSRGGRPRRDQAGDVERRLLDAASAVFLERGFAGTTCDEVASLAGAGKASLYARYPNKEALFAAVIRRNVERTLLPAAEFDASLSLLERLRAVGLNVLEHALEPHTISLMRLVIATAERFPDLAREAQGIGWEGGVARVERAIAPAGNATSDDRTLAERFIEMAFAPQQLRALLGDDPHELRAHAAGRVDRVLKLLIAEGLIDLESRGAKTRLEDRPSPNMSRA